MRSHNCKCLTRSNELLTLYRMFRCSLNIVWDCIAKTLCQIHVLPWGRIWAFSILNESRWLVISLPRAQWCPLTLDLSALVRFMLYHQREFASIINKHCLWLVFSPIGHPALLLVQLKWQPILFIHFLYIFCITNFGILFSTKVIYLLKLCLWNFVCSIF